MWIGAFSDGPRNSMEIEQLSHNPEGWEWRDRELTRKSEPDMFDPGCAIERIRCKVTILCPALLLRDHALNKLRLLLLVSD